jgi:glycosyltransferase involved in cell wall biosynthesis
VCNGCTGLLTEPANSQALSLAIEELINNPGRRLQMSTNCRRVAVTEYALEVQAGRYIELYESMLGKGCGAAVAANVTT